MIDVAIGPIKDVGGRDQMGTSTRTFQTTMMWVIVSDNESEVLTLHISTQAESGVTAGMNMTIVRADKIITEITMSGGAVEVHIKVMGIIGNTVTDGALLPPCRRAMAGQQATGPSYLTHIDSVFFYISSAPSR